jgi:tRNA (guanine-N7-)-methyltransferase
MTQRVIDITSPNFINTGEVGEEKSWAHLFGNGRPLALEIGCGTGHFVIDRAQQQPEFNFIAIDIYNKGCWKTCKKVDALGLTNVRVVRTEAGYLLETAFSHERLQAIYINCPDPWPKKRHRKRRLVNKNFLQMALSSLATGGDFYFSTDVADYAHDVAALLAGNPGFRNCLDQVIVNHLPGYPSSKYMRRFIEMGQTIHYLHHRQVPGAPDEIIPPQVKPEPRTGFRSRWPRIHNE